MQEELLSADSWTLAGVNVGGRLLLGTSQYPSLEILAQALASSQASVVTVSLRRQLSTHHQTENGLWDLLKSSKVNLLPNTAGCRSAKEAVNTALMAREVFQTHWIKLEVIGDEYLLSPDPFELVAAAKTLVEMGFEVFPYTTEDLVVAEALLHAGCRILMPWGAPIGSGLGPTNPHGLKTLRLRFPETTLIVDAGIGKPSHAVEVMEMGFDGVLLNTAVALAQNPPRMARAFAQAVNCGRMAFTAGPMESREFASPSTPFLGRPFSFD